MTWPAKGQGLKVSAASITQAASIENCPYVKMAVTLASEGPTILVLRKQKVSRE